MINALSGVVTQIIDGSIILDVHGISFELTVPQSVMFPINQPAKILTYWHWSAENGPSLYGFTHELERTIFGLIIGCSGMGPKLAIALLGSLNPQSFLQAIQMADEKALSKVSGVGAKKAEQLIVQLKHKVAKLIEQSSHSGYELDPALEQWKNITQVLQSLHYSRPEIDAALSHVQKEHKGQTVAFDGLMRSALSFLAKRL